MAEPRIYDTPNQGGLRLSGWPRLLPIPAHRITPGPHVPSPASPRLLSPVLPFLTLSFPLPICLPAPSMLVHKPLIPKHPRPFYVKPFIELSWFLALVRECLHRHSNSTWIKSLFLCNGSLTRSHTTQITWSTIQPTTHGEVWVLRLVHILRNVI